MCHLFISSSHLISLWMTRIGMTVLCEFHLPCPFCGLMFIAFGMVEVGLFAARSRVLLLGWGCFMCLGACDVAAVCLFGLGVYCQWTGQKGLKSSLSLRAQVGVTSEHIALLSVQCVLSSASWCMCKFGQFT